MVADRDGAVECGSNTKRNCGLCLSIDAERGSAELICGARPRSQELFDRAAGFFRFPVLCDFLNSLFFKFLSAEAERKFYLILLYFWLILARLCSAPLRSAPVNSLTLKGT